MTTQKYLSINENAQAAVIGWILKNKEFAYNCKMHLNSEMFIEPFHQEIFKKTTSFLNEYKMSPSLENLINLFYANKDYNIYKQKIYECEAQTKCFPLDYLSKEISAWIKLTIYKKNLHKAIAAYQNNQEDLLKTIFNDTLTKIVDVKFNGSVEYQFGNPVQDMEANAKSKENAVTTGLTELDSLLGGGLFRGEHTVIIAPSNTGKTTLCINFLFHNIMLNKHCLFLTHEMTASSIVDKIRQRMLYKTYPEFMDILKNLNGNDQELLNIAEKRLTKYLTYIPYCKAGGMYVEDVVDIIRQKNIELYNREGKYYDLMVDDYPGKLTAQSMKQYKDIRHGMRFVYEQFHQLALEFNSHAISPVQTNREGYKKNKYRENNETENLLGAEDISEAFAIAQDASNAITVNRSIQEQEKGVMTLFVDKTRSSNSRQGLEIKTDFSRAITHDQRVQDAYIIEKSKEQKRLEDNKLKFLMPTKSN